MINKCCTLGAVGRVSIVLAASLAFETAAAAAVTIYTSEPAYLAALGAGGYSSVLEGFENDAAWGSVRSTVAGGFMTALSVSALGITWQSKRPAGGITTGSGAAHSGSWGVFAYPHGDFSDPNPANHLTDGFKGATAGPIHGVGAWFQGQGASSKIRIILDEGTATERVVNVSALPLTSTPTFLGLIDTVSFNSFTVDETDGTFEDPNFVFADDFTLAVPSGSAGVCGDGVVGLGEQCDDDNTTAGDCCSATCTLETGACNDGNPCTTADVCSAGVCAGTATCNDGNPCTNDSCNPANGQCAHSANTASCNDGVFCNGADTCSATACSVHPGNPCSAGPQCANSCNESADNCFVAAGTACASDGNPCTDDRCNGSGACAHGNNTASCSDSLFCNGTDTCSGGACSSHTGNPCPGPDGDGNCAERCNETADNCTAADPNGAACNDGVFCNGVDACVGGNCGTHAGDPCTALGLTCNESMTLCQGCTVSSECNDSNVCTDETCNAGNCSYTFNSNPCDDGDACTLTDTCSGGVCVGSGCVTTTTLPPSSLCAETPASGCLPAQQSKLNITDSGDDAKDKIKWKSLSVATFDQAQLGQPATTTSYALCIYDGIGGVPTLVASLVVEPNTSWQDKSPKGLKYFDKTGAFAGVRKLQLKPSGAGNTKSDFGAAGLNVPMPVPVSPDAMFEQNPDVTVQLANDFGTCWTSSFSASQTTKNLSSRFTAVAK